ncbi:MAG: hypothetical protein RJA10_271, partial [Pseudomonadota bacterium]
MTTQLLQALPRPSARQCLRAALATLFLLGSAGLAQAQVTVNQILFPASVGRTLDMTVSVDYTRLSAAAATITIGIPSQLSINPPSPPAGCTVVAGPTLSCDVPAGLAGDNGVITFQLRGAVLGNFTLLAVGPGAGNTASNNGTVRSSA